MFNDTRPEVLISGAGPVGLFAALALTKREVPVQIIDTGVWPCQHSYALALHPESLDLLAEFGLRDAILAGSYPVRSIALCDAAGRKAKLNIDNGASECVAVLRQDVLEETLSEALRRLGVQVDWRHELSALSQGDSAAEAAIARYERQSRGYIIARSEWVVSKTEDLSVPYVIGADGYNSRVRRSAGVDFPEVSPANYYAVFEFVTDADLANTMHVVLGPETTDVLWPLPGGNCRWSFQLPHYTPPAEPLPTLPAAREKDRLVVSEGGHEPVLAEDNLKILIRERAPWFQGSIDRIDWRIVVRFEHRLASAHGNGRLWLAGDAAHLTGPAGIQSMNLGLAEAHELTTALHGILRRGDSPQGLAAYNQRWQRIWKQMQGIDGGLRAGAAASPWVAANAGRLTSCLPAYGDRLASLASQIGLDL